MTGAQPFDRFLFPCHSLMSRPDWSVDLNEYYSNGYLIYFKLILNFN